MSILERAHQWLRAARSPKTVRSEIEEEIRFHLEESARELIEGGADPEEAASRARELFGDVERTTLDCLTAQLGSRGSMLRIQWILIVVLLVSLGVVAAGHVAVVQEAKAVQDLLRAEQAALLARNKEIEALENSAREATRSTETSGEIIPRRAPTEIPPPPRSADLLKDVESWRSRFAEWPGSWRDGNEIAKDLIFRLDPVEARQVLEAVWDDLSVGHKKQVLKVVFLQFGHPETLNILHLGATDASLEVQNAAFEYLRNYAFQSFTDHFDGYGQWRSTWVDRPLAEVLVGNGRQFIQSLFGLSKTQLADRLRDFRDLDLRAADRLGIDLPQVLRNAGALTLVEDWILSNNEEARKRGLHWIRSLEPEELWLRQYVLPFLSPQATTFDEDVDNALIALGSHRNPWAVEPIITYLERVVSQVDDDTAHPSIWWASRALAEIGDPTVIPTMIGWIASNPHYDTVYGIGHFGLSELTGVSYEPTHDGEWWIDWWEKNRTRFPPEVQAISIPRE